MEPIPDGCPIGILVDIELQTKALKPFKENEDQASIKNKEENSFAVANSSHPWTRNCFLNQTPPKPTTILNKNLCTPKSNWKTPSPKSMKIISREASRIVDRLYSSPINCSEVPISDEVLPVMKSLDDAYFEEFHFKSKKHPAIGITIPPKNVNHDNVNLLDLTKCAISTVSNCISAKEVVSNENISTISLKSNLKPTKEENSFYEKTMYPQTLDKVLNEISGSDSTVNDKNKENAVTCENPSLAKLECVKELSSQPLVSEHGVPSKKMPEIVEGLGFENSLKRFSEKNEENVLLYSKTRETKYLSRVSKTAKNGTSIENGLKETSIKNPNSMLEQSTKYIAAKHSVLKREKSKENQNLEHHFSETMIEKPKALQRKSNIGRAQSLLHKKDPLFKTETMLGTPKVESSIRRFHSFYDGGTRRTIPAVEKKNIPATESSSRVLKPKMTLNQASSNGNVFSTPLQFQRSSQNNKLTGSSANPMRKSLAFNSNQSLIASGTKATTQKDHLSISKKSAVTSSSRFGKNLNKVPSLQQFKKDSLPRKLFP